jgi:uncharacterized membrane protein (DUF4010 family)
MSQNGLPPSAATLAIVLAAAMNGIVKTAASAIIGGHAMGLRIGVPLVMASLAGLGTAWIVGPDG